MKARIVFYCVVIAVLLATLAAIPSHATERRDTLLDQEAAQAFGSGHGNSTARPPQSAHSGKKPSPAHVLHETKDKSAAKKSDSSINKTTK